MARKSEPSLLGLPPELRNSIYELVLHLYQSGDPVTGRCSLVPPPMARVCRQIRHETLPMFFSKDVDFGRLGRNGCRRASELRRFKAVTQDDDHGYFKELQRLTPVNISLMRRVKVELFFFCSDPLASHCHAFEIDFVQKAAALDLVVNGWGCQDRSEMCDQTELELGALMKDAVGTIDLEAESAPRHGMFMRMLADRVAAWYTNKSGASYVEGTCRGNLG